MRRWAVLLLVISLPAAACSEGGTGDVGARAVARTPGVEGPELTELVRLAKARDYFALRERLDGTGTDGPPQLTVLRAISAHAFNRLERSLALLDTVFSSPASLSDSLRHEALRIRARNLLRLYRYEEAGDTFEELTAGPPAFVDSAELADFRNMLRLTRALGGVPPQRVVARSAGTLRRTPRGEVEIAFGDSVGRYGIDTGANLSLLVRSEAERLGFEVLPAGLEVGSATGLRVTADLAVAERVRLGGVELAHVVFLVLPDEAFTFEGHGLVLRGLIGFPVVEALGEIRFRGDSLVEIPREVPERGLRNLALHDLTPYLRVGYGGDDLLCVLDTGADETVFYEPFHRRYRARIEAEGVLDTARYGGAGGIRELPGYRLEDVTLRIGGRDVTLPEAHVHTTVIARSPASNVLDCNVGSDVLASRGDYTFNFRSMSVLLE